MPSYLSYLNQMSVVDADDDIQWITVRGNHIPIKKGENKEDAIKSFFESKGKESKKTAQKSPENNNKKDKGVVGQKKTKPQTAVKKVWKYPKVDFSVEGAEKKFIDETYPRVKKILSKAYFEEPQVTKDLQSIKGIEFHGLEYRRKTKDSAVGKINRERIENEYTQDWSDRKIMKQMYDLVRYTQLVDKDTFVEQAQKTIDILKKKGYKVVQLKNFWLPEVNDNGRNPYRGINMKWISPKGQKFEFQFNTNNNIEVKDKMHKLYVEARKLDDGDPKKAELNKQSLELTKYFDNPKDIEKLKK